MAIHNFLNTGILFPSNNECKRYIPKVELPKELITLHINSGGFIKEKIHLKVINIVAQFIKPKPPLNTKGESGEIIFEYVT